MYIEPVFPPSFSLLITTAEASISSWSELLSATTTGLWFPFTDPYVVSRVYITSRDLFANNKFCRDCIYIERMRPSKMVVECLVETGFLQL